MSASDDGCSLATRQPSETLAGALPSVSYAGPYDFHRKGGGLHSRRACAFVCSGRSIAGVFVENFSQVSCEKDAARIPFEAAIPWTRGMSSLLPSDKCRCRYCYCCLIFSHPHPNQNKLGLEEVPTLSFGGSDGGGGDSGGDGGDAPASSADKTIFKVKVTGFGDKAKIKVYPAWCGHVRRSSRPTCTSHIAHD